jgi:drug/metabolite transporter (DMT)-like permease
MNEPQTLTESHGTWGLALPILEAIAAVGAIYHIYEMIYKFIKYVQRPKPTSEDKPERRRKLGVPFGLSRSQAVGALCALLSALIWSLSYVSLSYVTPRTTPFVTNYLLLGFGTVFLLGAWKLAQMRELARGGAVVPAVAWTDADFWVAVVSNLASFMLFVYALNYISASQTIALQKINPIFVAFTAWLWFGARPTRSTWIAVVVVVLGTLVILANGAERIQFDNIAKLRGSMLAVAAGMAFAVFSTILEKNERNGAPRVDRLGLMATIFVFSFLLASTMNIFHERVPFIAGRDLVILALNGLRIAIVYALFHAAIQRIGALRASVIVALEVPMTMLWDWLVLGHPVGLYLAIGSAAIVTGGLTLLIEARTAQAVA